MATYKKTKDSKQYIKSIAKEMFLSSGYDNVKVEDIAKQANVAKGLVFYHFASKEGLLAEIVKGQAYEMFKGFTDFIKDIPPDIALLQLFQGMFTTAEPLDIAEGFFDGPLPKRYHYAVDKARQEVIFPIIHDLIKRGCDEGLFQMNEIDISFEVISMGFQSYLDSHFDMFADSEYHKKFLKGAAYILNTTLHPTRIKFEFKINNEEIEK